MMRLTDVVKNLIIINVIIFVVSVIFFQDLRGMLAFHYPDGDGDFQPFQIISHMFMHGQTRMNSLFSSHLIFNMVGLGFLGPALESLWGPKRFLFYYLFTGIGALFFNVLVSYIEINYFGGYPGAVWGASGALFGILLAFGLKFPNLELQMLIIPISAKAKYFVLFYAVLELFFGLSGMQTGIAHFAHLGGAVAGLILISYWDKYGSRL